MPTYFDAATIEGRACSPRRRCAPLEGIAGAIGASVRTQRNWITRYG